MIKNSAKIGAIFYILWGLIHIFGGGLMLKASLDRTDLFLQMLTGLETIQLEKSKNLESMGAVAANGVFAYHSFNIIWFGLLSLLIGVLLNWKNSISGYWLNLGIVGFADIGLLYFMVARGIMSLSDAWIGPLLFVMALVFSTIGIFLLDRKKIRP